MNLTLNVNNMYKHIFLKLLDFSTRLCYNLVSKAQFVERLISLLVYGVVWYEQKL